MLRIIAGKFKGRLLLTPKVVTTRPTQGMLREAVFNICQHRIEGSHFLDMYAGSGAMAFEAISRGAEKATLIEKNKLAIQAILENRSLLGVEAQTEVIKTDVRKALEQIDEKFDIVYIDPPYGTKVETLIEPLCKILQNEAIVFLEERDTQSKAPVFLPLQLKNSRKFGIASLHQYVFTASLSS